MNISLRLTRDVTPMECSWLHRTYRRGEIIQRYRGCTYGIVSSGGVACSADGAIPFFELPEGALTSSVLDAQGVKR